MLDSWGLRATLHGLERCARGMVEALGEHRAGIQTSVGLLRGVRGAGASRSWSARLADIAAAGALALLDVKRGDIGSTMDAYAAAYLSDGSPLAADAITLSPYLGFGRLWTAPLSVADRYGRGVYVLALTSNPEGRQVQHADAADGRTGRPAVVDEAAAATPSGAPGQPRSGRSRGRRHHRSYGNRLHQLNGSILAPGIGAQGGRRQISRRSSAGDPSCASFQSREVMWAGPQPAALQAAATRMLGEMKGALQVSYKPSHDRLHFQAPVQTRTRAVTIPPLSDEQRQQARHAATEARRRRAEIKQTLRSGERSLAEVLDLAERTTSSPTPRSSTC